MKRNSSPFCLYRKPSSLSKVENVIFEITFKMQVFLCCFSRERDKEPWRVFMRAINSICYSEISRESTVENVIFEITFKMQVFLCCFSREREKDPWLLFMRISIESSQIEYSGECCFGKQFEILGFFLWFSQERWFSGEREKDPWPGQ